MSARPGRVKQIVNVDLDRSQPDILKAPAFIDTVDHVWGLVREEAIRAQGTTPA
jgi:NitT/TauT family transport system ATP-binding protein